MDKQTLIKNFSKYAYAYDKYADVQNTAAFELISQIRENGFKSILEIGCGTGNYTAILRQKFKIAKIKAVDISGKMIEIARNKVKDA